MNGQSRINEKVKNKNNKRRVQINRELNNCKISRSFVKNYLLRDSTRAMPQVVDKIYVINTTENPDCIKSFALISG